MKLKTPRYNWQYFKFGTISLCMIMRDNAATLTRCLNSVAGLVDEVVICDTGSKDNSIDIAKAHGAKIVEDAWQDDFARPRNKSIQHATMDWILIMDPDEVILEQDHDAIRWLTRSKNVVAIRLTTRNYSPSATESNYRTLVDDKDPLGKFSGFVPSTKTRFFKNGLGIIFEGCWHELVDWYLMRHKLPVGTCPVPVHHWTHEISQASMREKSAFYLRMGYKKVRQWPTHGQAWWELAVAQAINAQRYAALLSLRNAFKFGFGWQDQYFLVARLFRLLDKKDEGAFAFQKGVCSLFPMLTHIDANKKPTDALLKMI